MQFHISRKFKMFSITFADVHLYPTNKVKCLRSKLESISNSHSIYTPSFSFLSEGYLKINKSPPPIQKDHTREREAGVPVRRGSHRLLSQLPGLQQYKVQAGARMPWEWMFIISLFKCNFIHNCIKCEWTKNSSLKTKTIELD